MPKETFTHNGCRYTVNSSVVREKILTGEWEKDPTNYYVAAKARKPSAQKFKKELYNPSEAASVGRYVDVDNVRMQIWSAGPQGRGYGGTYWAVAGTVLAVYYRSSDAGDARVSVKFDDGHNYWGTTTRNLSPEREN